MVKCNDSFYSNSLLSAQGLKIVLFIYLATLLLFFIENCSNRKSKHAESQRN